MFESAKGLYDQGMLDMFAGIRANYATDYVMYIGFTQTLIALFMLILWSTKAYEMMVGKDIDWAALFRPFILFIVVTNWTVFVDISNTIFEGVASRANQELEQKQALVSLKMKIRKDKTFAVGQKMSERLYELNKLWDDDEVNLFEFVGEAIETIEDTLKGTFIMAQSYATWFGMQFIEFIVLSIFQIAVYIAMFIQLMFFVIMVILGPLAFGISVLDKFKDAWINWLSRFISVGLMLPVIYIVLGMAMAIVAMGLQSEIEALDFLSVNEDAFLLYVMSGNIAGTSLYLITLIVGALGLFMVPIISTWVVATNGFGSALSSGVRGAARIAGKVM